MAKTKPHPRHIRNRKADLTAHKPNVILDFLFDRGLFYISIENIGDGPALGVATRFMQKITGLGGTQDITSLPLFQRIEFLAPHKSIVTFLHSSTAFFSRGEPKKISVKISYRDVDQKHHQVTIHHDLGIYEDVGYLTSPAEQFSLSTIGAFTSRKERE